MMASKPGFVVSAKISGNASGQWKGSRSTVPAGRGSWRFFSTYGVRSFFVADRDVQLEERLVEFLALQFRVREAGRRDRVGDRRDLAGQFLRLGEQPRLVFDVADRDAAGGGDLAAEVGGLGELVAPFRGEVEGAVVQAAALLRVHVQRLQLLQADQAEERVPGGEAVVEEAEGPFGVHRDQPQRQLRHLDGEGVDVDAVQAVLGDLAAGLEQELVGFGVRADAAGGAVQVHGEGFGVTFVQPRLDQAVGEVAAGGDEERAGAHRDVRDLQFEDLLGRADPPLRRVRRLQGTGAVDEGLQGAFGDLFGEGPGRVVGAGRGAAVRAGHVPAARREDRGQAELVEAEQAEERRDLLGQFGVGDGPLERR